MTTLGYTRKNEFVTQGIGIPAGFLLVKWSTRLRRVDGNLPRRTPGRVAP